MPGRNFSEWSCLEREKQHYSMANHDIRRWYQRDIDQITHSTCFRKLQRKSQLLSEKDPRSRSRLIHTIEVSRIAMEISEKLGLSKELTEAICLAHDIGTSPYGCIGNTFLREHARQNFSHEMAGALMLLLISKKSTNSEDDDIEIESLVEDDDFRGEAQVSIDSFPGQLYASRITDGKNDAQYYLHHISPEIVDGVFNHGDAGCPNTLEGQVVRFADNIAYLSQDIEDLITTKILPKRFFVKYAGLKNLQYTPPKTASNPTPKTRTMAWTDIDNDPQIGSLKDSFNETRGRRIAAFISRFVEYNLKQLNAGNVSMRWSEILNKEIPVLEYDDGTKFVIDFMWNFIEGNYEKPLIKTSSELQKEKMSQLWTILEDPEFQSKNTSFKNFMGEITNNSLFSTFGKEWKMAFFISHLSWFEVDLIIDSYHERNNTFELDISY